MPEPLPKTKPLWFKIAACLAAALLLMLIAGSVALKRFLSPEKVRELVISGAEKSLGRQVKLGEVSVGLLTGLTLKDFSISEAGGFTAGTFASVASFNARPRWSALLRRKVIVDNVAASGLSVKVVKKPDGAYNFSSILTAAGPAGGTAGAAAGGGASNFQLAVSKFKMSQARLAYEEPGGRRSVVVSALDAKLAGFSLATPFAADVSGKTSGHWDGKALDGAFSFAGKVDLGGQDPKRFSVDARALEVSAQGWSAKASGKVKDLSKPEVDLKIAARGPSGPVAEVRFAGRLSPPQGDAPLAAEGKLELSSPGMSAGGIPVPPLKAAAQFSYRADSLALKSFTLLTSAGKIEASGFVAALSTGKPAADLTLSAALDLPAIRAENAPWLKLPKGASLPAVKVESKARLKGDDLELSSLRLRAAAGTLEASGAVRKLTSGAPEPNLDLTAKLALPALKSADIPLASVPAGLALPASQWDAALSFNRDEAQIRSLKILIGHNDFQIDGARLLGLRGDKPLLNVVIKCRRFQLDELTAVSPLTRELKLTGGGFFALGLTGRLPRPVLEGKLQFKDIGADVSGLSLAGFTGTASFNEKRIDVPNLRGQLGDGELLVNLTIKNYSKAPDVDLEASLSRFDLGKLLAAKAALSKPPSGAAPDPVKSPATQAPPMSARGRMTVKELIHPNAQARELRLNWDLSGITPDFKQLTGGAKVYSSGGRFANLGGMATESKIVKVLIFPLMIFQKIGSIGGVKLFPDFNNVEYTELAGDYGFKNGLMALNDSHLNSAAANVSASGEIDLPAEKLNLTVTAQVARLAPIDVDVRGTFDKPATSVKLGKFLADPAKQLLQNFLRK